jgi:hypothetical protein
MKIRVGLAAALLLMAAPGAAADEDDGPPTAQELRERAVRKLAIEANVAVPGKETPLTPEVQQARKAKRKQFGAGDMSNSKAAREMRTQILDEIFAQEMAVRPNCEPKLMSTRVLEERGIGRWSERWFIRTCLERIPYRITVAPEPPVKDKTGKTIKAAGPGFTVAPDLGTHGFPLN